MNCAICFSENLKEKEKYDIYSLYECQDCFIQFWWPLEHPGKKFYDDIWGADFSSQKSRSMLPWAQRQFLKNPPLKEGKLLDVGCGTGDFLNIVCRAGFDAWGLDIAESAIDAAKRNYNLQHLYCADIAEWAQENSHPCFSIVTAFEVLEHLIDPLMLMDSIKRVLAPGGHLVLSIPNFERIGKKREKWDYPPHHFFRWRKNVLRKFLERNGFRVKQIIEQPYGVHILYEKGLLSCGIIKFLKSRHINKAGSIQKSSCITALADYKNLIFLKILKPFFFPVALMGRCLGWKYVELYCVAKKI